MSAGAYVDRYPSSLQFTAASNALLSTMSPTQYLYSTRLHLWTPAIEPEAKVIKFWIEDEKSHLEAKDDR